jgi:hypothetical protein
VRIVFLDSASRGEDERSSYVGEVAPVLAEDHQVSIVSVYPGLLNSFGTMRRVRRAIINDLPDILHLNHIDGAALGAVTFMVSEASIQPPIVFGLHDDSLLRHGSRLNQTLTRNVRLVISPSASLLDQHLARGFFPNAMRAVIPYEMPYHGGHLVEAYRRMLIARRAGDLGNRAA